MAKIIFLAGSTRTGSINQKLAQCAADMAKTMGAEVTVVDLNDYDMPLYNGDLEKQQGLPEAVKKLKQIFVEHDGLFIASPEYNGSFSALLKNTIDWLSRAGQDDEKPLAAYKGKVAAIAATSPGALGGLRGLVPLRMLLGNIGVTVIPSQIAIGAGFKAFDSAGKLLNVEQENMLKSVIGELLRTVDKLNG